MSEQIMSPLDPQIAPQVSVVIPTLNRWKMLERALASALAQERVRIEVIVIDDGSTDETPARLAELDDPRVRVHRHPQPSRVAVARNAGIELARARWIAFLDDDDVWSTGKVASLVDALEARGATWGYSGGYTVNADLSVIEAFAPPPPDEIVVSLLQSNAVHISTVIARADAVRAIGGFDSQLFTMEDWDFLIRLSRTGPAAVSHGKDMAYMQHRGGKSQKDPRAKVAQFEYLRAKHGRNGRRIESAPFWRWIGYNLYQGGEQRAAMGAYLRAALRHGDGVSALRAATLLLGRGPTERALALRRRTPQAPVEWLEAYRDRGSPT